MQQPATAALRRLSQGAVVLSCYGLASMVILVVLGAVTTGLHTFARTAAVLVVVGLIVMGVVAAGNRRARRMLLAARPDLAATVRAERYLPGNGLAVFVYVPFLLLGVCLGATAREAMHFHGGIYGFIVATIFFALFSARAEVSYDRSCRAPYRGFLMHAAQAGG